MPNIGSKYGRKATWIGASGDQTFLRIDEALINSHVLATSEIFASKHIIGNTPRQTNLPLKANGSSFPIMTCCPIAFCFLSVRRSLKEAFKCLCLYVCMHGKNEIIRRLVYKLESVGNRNLIV